MKANEGLVRLGDGPERVYRELRRAIIEQALQPGSRLPETEVAARHGVSRTIVRAAFERLVNEGLVSRANNRSARVASLGLEEAADLIDIRQGLEGMVVERLASAITREAIERLQAHVDCEQRASTLRRAEAVRLAGEFHVLLAELTGSALLTRYISDVVSRASLIITAHDRPHSSSCAVREHHDLIALLGRGDVDGAKASMRQHLAHVAGRARLPTQA